MIVEVFIKGSNFKKLYDTFWNVKKIVRSGYYYFLVIEEDKKESIPLSLEKYELRVTY